MTGGLLGLRVGELAGLKRHSVNLLTGELRAVGTIERHGDGSSHYVSETKTSASRRSLSVPGSLVEILSRHLGTHDSEWIFPAPNRGHINYSSWRTRFWVPAVEAAGLEHCGVHVLRHTAAAIWISLGAHPVTVQRRLGHANTSITFKRYQHLFPEQETQLTTQLDGILDQQIVSTSSKKAAESADIVSIAVHR